MSTPEEQFTNVCNKMFQKLFDKLDGIDNRLFHDNGVKSVQTKLNEQEIWQKNHDKAIETQQGAIKEKMAIFSFFALNWKYIIIILFLLYNHFSARPFTKDEVNQVARQIKSSITIMEPNK
jgi:hypothetical protein